MIPTKTRHWRNSMMPTVGEILTKKEKEIVLYCKKRIREAKTISESDYYKEKALNVLEDAKRRYYQEKIASLEAQIGNNEQAATI